MSLVDAFRNVLGGEPKSEEAVGTIIRGPRPEPGAESDTRIVFWLDSDPATEFHQTLSPLASARRKGDRVKVHFHRKAGDRAVVDWVEQI